MDYHVTKLPNITLQNSTFYSIDITIEQQIIPFNKYQYYSSSISLL
jgi:hypothetical protein